MLSETIFLSILSYQVVCPCVYLRPPKLPPWLPPERLPPPPKLPPRLLPKPPPKLLLRDGLELKPDERIDLLDDDEPDGVNDLVGACVAERLKLLKLPVLRLPIMRLLPCEPKVTVWRVDLSRFPRPCLVEARSPPPRLYTPLASPRLPLP